MSRREQRLEQIFAQLTEHHEETVRHLHSVRDLTYMLARALDYPEGHAEAIATAGLLHDIGKLYIPVAILDAPRKLSPDEWRAILGHPFTGAQMAEDLGLDPRIKEWILAHHERLDGTGYPYGRTDIPPEALVIATTDIWDATGGVRPYSGYTGISERLSILQGQAPKIGAHHVRTLIEIIGTKRSITGTAEDTADELSA